MKRFLKKSLVCILILFLLMNFTSATIMNYSYAGFDVDSIFTGLIGLITWIPRAIIMALLTGVNVLISGFATLGLGDIADFEGIAANIFVTPFHVFFNKIAILNVNFFNFEGITGTVLTFRTAVAGWYYTMRLIASMILAVILIYIGIRMALTSIASEKALYKKMLVDWATSLALLFLLHYIMIFVLSCNDALVNALLTICEQDDLTGFIGELTGQALGLETSSAIAAMILYGVIIYQTISFIFSYVKRMLTIGFLIMIAPLITITYSIDKIGDQKAQALNTWLKEFSYNILIQPFHCILFASFASVAFDLIGVGTWTAGSSLAEMILAIACIQFIKTGENLVKKIFGFGQASSLADMAAGMAATGVALKYGGKAAEKVGAGVAKTKNFVSQNKDQISKATKGLSSKVSKATNGLANQFRNVDKEGNLTKRGQKNAEKRAEKATPANSEFARGNAGFDKMVAFEAKKMTDSFNAKKEAKKQKLTAKQEKISDKVKKKEEKAKSKYEAKHGEGSYERHLETKQTKKEERNQRKKEISGVVGKYMSKNGAKIASNTAGVVAGLVGFGSGLDGALAGFGIGGGLVKGYMSNTNKTLEKQVTGAAQAVANMNEGNEEFDLEKKTHAVYLTAQNGGFDKVEEKLDQILERISSLHPNQKENFENAVKMQLNSNPAGLNNNFINDYVSDNASDEDIQSMRQYITLAAEANYAQAINTASSAGRSVSDIANAAVAGVTMPSMTTTVNEITENTTIYQTVNNGIDEAQASQLKSEISNLSDNVQQTNDSIKQAQRQSNNEGK